MSYLKNYKEIDGGYVSVGGNPKGGKITRKDEAVNEEMDDSLERATTTASSLEAEQDSGNINKTQSKATPNESSSQGTDLGVNIPRRDKDSLKLKELMELCTNLQNRGLDLENTKTTQALEIDSLKRRVKKLEKKKRSSFKEVSVVDEVNAVSTATTTTITIDDITLAKALMEIKSAKPKADKVVIQELEQAWDDIQAKIDSDYQLPQGLQEEEQEELTDEEKERLVNTIIDYKTELVVESLKEAEAEVTEGSSKRAGEELEHENAKKQKMGDDKESVELKQCLEIVLKVKDDVTIDATPLSSKSSTIVDYKIHKKGRKAISKFLELMERIVRIKRLLDDLEVTAVKSFHDDGFKPLSDDGKKVDEDLSKGNECYDQEKEDNVNNINNVNPVSSIVNAASTDGVNTIGEPSFDPDMPALEDISTFNFSNKDEDDDVTLVDLPNGKRAIGIKWAFKNENDKRGIVIRNKAKLVAQGHIQKEGIGYDEVFVPVARIEAIRLFLAYASLKDFVVYQMDVKSVFLYEKIEEEVYVCQPLGFENLDFPDRVYKVEKALYRLHQAPNAWKELCNAFEKLMQKKFQMSSMGELTFFLRLQVKQKNDGIFISQDKYVGEIFKKFGFIEVKNASTPI
nr:copia protein [Tanacetum cinerariifolium]